MDLDEKGEVLFAEDMSGADIQKKTMPLISITTATYNCANTIVATLESMLAQTYNNIEYIVMDGGSSDGTYEIAKQYENKFAQRGVIFRCFQESDRGMYDAINKAMDRATGDIVGNINGDDTFEASALERVAQVYERAPFEAFYADVLICTGKGAFIKKAKRFGLYETSRCWNHPTSFWAGRAKNMRYRLDNPYADFDFFLRAYHQGMRIEILNETLAVFSFGGISTKKSWKDVRKRIGWKAQIYRDNHCSPLSIIEGAMIEVLKYIKA